MKLVNPTVFDIGWLSERMRPDEIEQWCALTGSPEYDANAAATSIIATMGPFGFTLLDDDRRPVVCGGFVEDRPGVFQTWMIGTPEGWETQWRGITLHSRRMIDRMLASGRAHRIQTHALHTRTAALAWYERGLKMNREGTLRRYFANGQDAVVFSKVREGTA